MEEIRVIIPNRKAVAYYRVSSEQQRKKESIDLQKTTTTIMLGPLCCILGYAEVLLKRSSGVVHFLFL
jgi:hypothetical protein